MAIELKDLPYAENALEPHMSKEIIHFHYNKRHKAYVENLNKLIKDTEFQKMSLEEIVKKSGSGPIFNNAAQAWNHQFFWNSMSPDSKFVEDSKIGKAIIAQFKTIKGFEKEFSEKAKKLFGSGWLWLVSNDGKVSIEATHNAHGPTKHTPLFVCDNWEHAYELQYPADKPSYMEAFYKIINWEFAETNFK